MAKKVKKLGTFSEIFEKTRNGVRQKYVKVVIRNRKKTVVKQYRYRGGTKRIYEREAKLKKGTTYYIDYDKERIIKSPSMIDKLTKKVKTRQKGKRTTKKGKKPIVKLPKINLIRKKVRHPPKPVHAEKIVKMMDGKVFYEREHSIFDFTSPQREQKFLLDILSKATKRKSYAKKLLANFDKIKLKMSYAIVIDGIDKQGNQKEIGNATAVGKRPSEIVQALKESGLTPSNDFQEIGYDVNIRGIDREQQHIKSGTYRITNVRVVVKFYNNPQYTLKA